jgi:hypothetical protein
MNEEPKDRPVRELLEDIGRHRVPTSEPPRGLVNPKLVHRITFFSSLAGLLFITAALLGALWESVNQVFAFRSIFSVCIVLAALYVFRFINGQFE